MEAPFDSDGSDPRGLNNQTLSHLTGMANVESLEEILARSLAVAEMRCSAAEAELHAKDDFIMTVAHELRTPLAAIVLWTESLRPGPLKEEEREEVRATIHLLAQSMQRLVEDLLDLQGAATGQVRLELEHVDVEEAVREALAMMRPAAVAAQVLLRSEVAMDAGAIMCDQGRLRQILLNLIANSIKFTSPRGVICVGACRMADAIELSVQDTGRGMRPEFLPHAFDRFSQDGAEQRGGRAGPRRGLGIGLSVVRELAALHGGSVRAASDGERQGATCTVTLPAGGPPRGGPRR